MKRILYLLIVVCVVSAAAGWFVARARAPYREREFVEQAKIAAEKKANEQARGRAKYLAGLAREADEVVISFSGAKAMGENDVRFSDLAGLSQFADIIEKSSFKATAHGFWVSTPAIRFNRNHEQILELTGLGGILRAYGKQVGGDFIVGEENPKAIHALIQNKQSKPSGPWLGYGL